MCLLDSSAVDGLSRCIVGFHVLEVFSLPPLPRETFGVLRMKRQKKPSASQMADRAFVHTYRVHIFVLGVGEIKVHRWDLRRLCKPRYSLANPESSTRGPLPVYKQDGPPGVYSGCWQGQLGIPEIIGKGKGILIGAGAVSRKNSSSGHSHTHRYYCVLRRHCDRTRLQYGELQQSSYVAVRTKNRPPPRRRSSEGNHSLATGSDSICRFRYLM